MIVIQEGMMDIARYEIHGMIIGKLVVWQECVRVIGMRYVKR